MTNNLEGQKALVTGATSGIGRAIALRLGRDAADMMVHGRELKRGREVVDAISAHGGQARFMLPTAAIAREQPWCSCPVRYERQP
jgi:NAD(P)-dependent dehydrogenase (short-subunit alcohol dehydrogenase family)